MTPVFVYTQPDCRPCKRVIHLLEEGGVDIRVIDISKDSLMRDYVVQHLGAKSTPVVEAQGYPVVRGYQPDQLMPIIAHYGPQGDPDYTDIYDDIHDYVYEGDE